MKVELFCASQVIGEDNTSAMISSENFGRHQQIQTKLNGMYYLIETEELPAFVDQKIAEAIHDRLRKDPTVRLESVYQQATRT